MITLEYSFNNIIQQLDIQCWNLLMINLQKNSKSKIKPLVVGDVITALINQDNTIDQTQYYKKLLSYGFTDKKEDVTKSQNVGIRNRLPSFANQEFDAKQLLDYHIHKKTAQSNIPHYEILLQQVDQEIKNSLESYSDKLKEGQSTIQSLMGNLGEVCTLLATQRKYLSVTIQNVKEGYDTIAPKLRKINNIKKVLSVTKIWGSAKLPYIMSIDAKHPAKYNIKDIFQLITFAEETIKNNLEAQKESKSFALKKMLTTLKEKKDELVGSIYEHFQNSIINFTSTRDYQIRYSQYLYLCDINLCSNILTHESVRKIIEINSKKMFNDILGKITVLKNIDLLGESNYLTFYDEIIEEFVIYFRSWHYVTKFHIDNETNKESFFLENRRYVFENLSEVLANSIKFSNKFISLQYKIKLKLCEKLQDYIEAGIKWMGFYENAFMTLKKQVTGKMKKQLEQLFTLYNNLIKNMLAKQLSVSALEKIDDPEQIIQNKNIMSFQDIDYDKVTNFLNDNIQQLLKFEKQSDKNQQKNKKNIVIPIEKPPHVQLRMGQILIQMICEYIQRSKYLETDKFVYIRNITEHFQLILYSLFQVSVRKQVGEKLYVQIRQKLKNPPPVDDSIGSGLKIGNQQSSNIKKINQLWKISQFQRKYDIVLQFSSTVGKRYEGVWISGFLDIDKVYDSNSQQIITGYMKLQMRLIRDILKIQQWLIKVIPLSSLKVVKKGSEEISKLKDITKNLFSMVIQNHIDYTSKKLGEVGNMLIKLKWEMKKYNQEVAQNYKQYKLKICETFKYYSLSKIVKIQCSNHPQMISIVKELELETFYKALLEMYGKVEKMNDNGRQLLRMDYIQISKALKEIDMISEKQSWEAWFQKYLEFISERSYKDLLEKVRKIGVLYPPICWKYHLLWIIGDMSSKVKKQYYSQLYKIYFQYLGEGS